MLATALPAVPLAFAAGLVSVLSPCVLPLIPAYAAFLSGEAGSAGGAGTLSPGPGGAAVLPRRAPVLLHGAAFVLGFSAVFVAAFYVLAAFDDTVLTAHRQVVDIVAGAIIIVFALQTMGLIRIPLLMRDLRAHPRPAAGTAGAALLGLSFGAGWTPCLGPTLGAILVVAASGGFGGLPLMLVYCLGLAVPFLVVAVLCDRLQGPLRAINRRLRLVSIVAGLLLLAFGVLLLTGRITELSALSPGAPFDL
ncbi:MAG TPA: cytochrome c biogenesis protein CcdA [Candidatus Binatia bacterium]|nr:cytochrome c biogenesis protein CcdA [Candidatus Binatia bacterium]